jgi:hypothetical protein
MKLGREKRPQRTAQPLRPRTKRGV